MLVRQIEVQQVIGKAIFDNMIFYLIKWKNKPVKESTWKHQQLLPNIKDKTATFNKQIKDIQLPIIYQKYLQTLQHKLYELNQQQFNQAKNINIQKTSKKVQKIIGKAKISKNIFYLVKWMNQPVSASTWQSSFKLPSASKLTSKFNKQNQHQQLPYIDTLAITYLHQVHQVQHNQRKTKKQQLNDKKQRKKNNENNLNLLVDQFMKKLKRLQKNSQKQKRRKVMTQYRQQKERKNKQITNQEQILIQKESLSSNEEDDKQKSNNDEDQNQKQFLQINIKQEINEQGQYQLIQEKNNEINFDFFKEQESGQIIDQIAQRIQMIQSQSQVIYLSIQKNQKQKLQLIDQKPNIQELKIQEPFQEFNSQSFDQFEQKPHTLHTQIKVKQSKLKCQPKTLEKVLSNKQKVQNKKIVTVKFQFKVDSVTKKNKKQNLYRVQYQDGDVRYWTTSQLHKELSSPIQWIQYLQRNAIWQK